MGEWEFCGPANCLVTHSVEGNFRSFQGISKIPFLPHSHVIPLTAFEPGNP